MNIIEALFITLSLDTSDYEKKQKGVLTSLTKMGEASDKQTKLIAESGKKAAQTFSLLKVEVLGALAAFGMGDGFKSFITANMNGEAVLGRLSANLGMSASELKAWGYAAESVGGKASDATNALQSVAGGLAEAQLHGHSALMQAARFYGIGIDLKSPEQTLINISKRLTEFHNRQQALKAAQELGVGDIFNLLMQGPDALQDQVAHYRKRTGNVDTKDAIALQRVVTDIKSDIGDIQDDIFKKMAPGLLIFAENFKAFLNNMRPKLEALAVRLANWLDSINWQDVINKIGRFIDKVQEVVKAMGGWKTIAEILGGVLALKLLSPLLGLIGGFMRLIPLLGSATAGFAGLGAAAGPALAILIGGAGGWAIGKQIDKHLSAGTKDAIGSAVAHVLAFFGNDEAKAAIQGTHLGELRAMASQNAPKIGSDFLGKYDPQHSRQFGGNNAGMFAILEKEYGLPAGTLARKFQVESANGTRLVSKAGALGPMQFMPATAAAMGLGDNVMDLDASAKAAAQYLQQLHNQFGDWDKANAAYNWGPGNLKKDVAAHGAQWLNFAPSETQKYVAMHRLLQSASPSSSFAKRQGPTTNTNTVSINTLNVNTNATDANGVAKGMKTAMQANPLIAGSVTSLA